MSSDATLRALMRLTPNLKNRESSSGTSNLYRIHKQPGKKVCSFAFHGRVFDVRSTSSSRFHSIV